MIRIRVRYRGEDIWERPITFCPEHGDAVEVVDAEDQPILHITSLSSDEIVIELAPGSLLADPRRN